MPTPAPSSAARRRRHGVALVLLAALLAAPAATLAAAPAAAAPVPHVPVVTVSPAAPTTQDAVTVTSTITGCTGATQDPIVIYLVRGPSFQNDYYESGQFTDGGDTYTVSKTFPAGTFVPGDYTAESYGGLEPCYPPYEDDYIYSEQVPFTVSTFQVSTVVSASAAATTFGQPVLVDVVVDSTTASGTVTVTEDGTALGSGAVVAGTARVDVGRLGAGSHQLVAEYDGDVAHRGSTSAPFAAVVARAGAPLSATASPSSALRGDDVVLEVVGPTGSRGTVTVSESGTALATDVPLPGGLGQVVLEDLGAGRHDLLVSFSGDDDHEPSSTTVAVTVDLRPTTTAVRAERDGSDLRLVAEVVPDADWSDHPSGSVLFTDGEVEIGTVALVDGVAELQVPSAAVGSHEVRARYLGDATTGPSTSVPVTAVVPGLAVIGPVSASTPARVQASGFAPGSIVQVLLDGTHLVFLVADAVGGVDAEVDVPATAAGRMLLSVVGVDALGDPVELEQEVTVLAVVVQPPPTTTPAPTPTTPLVPLPAAPVVVTQPRAVVASADRSTLVRTGVDDPAAVLLLGGLAVGLGMVLVGASRTRRPI